MGQTHSTTVDQARVEDAPAPDVPSRVEEVPGQQPQPLPAAYEKRSIQTQQQAAPQFSQYAPFQPPAVYAQQAQQPNPKPRPWNKRWHIAKLALSTASIISSVVLWAVSIVLLANYTGDGGGDYFDVVFDGAFGLTMGGVALLWVTADLITMWVSKEKRGITPGANVALHLIIWLLASAAIGMTSTFLSWYLEVQADYTYEDGNSSDRYSSYSQSYYDVYSYEALSAMIRLVETLVAFLALIFVIHFALFVGACVETHRYNAWKYEHAGRTVYVHVPVAVAPGQQVYGYWAPLPGQQHKVFHPVSGPMPSTMTHLQPQPQMAGAGPVIPPQAQIYGYYAPPPAQAQAQAPGTVRQQQAPVVPMMSPPVPTTSPSTRPVSPVASSSR